MGLLVDQLDQPALQEQQVLPVLQGLEVILELQDPRVLLVGQWDQPESRVLLALRDL